MSAAREGPSRADVSAARDGAQTVAAGSEAAAGARGPLQALHLHSGNLYGGIETILGTIARRQREVPGSRHGFALCFEGRCADELAAAGAEVAHLGAVRVRHPWAVVAARRRLAAALGDRRPDVAVTHSPWTHAILAPVVREHGIPLVHWRHGASDGRHWLERWARRTPPDLTIAVSRFVASSAGLLFPRVRTEVLYAPVESAAGGAERDTGARRRSLRDEVRRSLGAAPDAVVIVQVSRMEEGKGHTVLIDALDALRARGDWACWIVGGAQRPREVAYERRLRARVAGLALGDRIRFLGARDDVPALLAAADLCCQPNTRPEGFSIALVEALACGVPVVTTVIGAAPEVVDDACGALVAPGDAGALAQALRSLLDDPARRAALGAAGPALAAALSDPVRQIARLGDLLRTVALREVSAPEAPTR